MNTKKLLFTILFLIIGLVLVFSLVQLFKPSVKELSRYEDFAEYLNAYTSGYISRNSNIIIEFNHEVNLNKQLTEKQLEEIVKFSPSIKGKVYWKDDYTLAFHPEKPLPYEQQYVATIQMKNIILDGHHLNDFIFSFFVIPQTFTLNEYSIKTLSDKNYSMEQLTALLELSDQETPENIEPCINVTWNGNKIPFKLFSEDHLTYRIIIDSISRTENPETLKISCDGKYIECKAMVEKTIEIPSIDEFKVMDCFVHKYPEQSISLVFSDPIDGKQDLGGLITLSNDLPLRFTIEENTVTLYPSQLLIGDYTLKIYQGILNTLGKRLPKSKEFTFTFEDIKPQVKFTDNGFIIPTNQNGAVIPFNTMNLKEVDVRIIRIYENNLLQFFQNNDYNDNNELQRVGKIIYKGKLPLTISLNDRNKWKRFYLDISKYVKTEPGAVYRVSLGFRPFQTLYPCNENLTESTQENIDRSFDYFDSYSDYYNYYYDYEDYWQNRDNPCHKAYYGSQRCVSKNIYVTDMALISKLSSSNRLTVYVSDINSATPLSGVTIEVFNYPKQVIAKGTTDGEGKVTLDLKEEASFIIAQKNELLSILKLSKGLSLSTASFDVSGEQISSGIKGFIYGERGVWRPGDSLYLTFIMQESTTSLPLKQPIVFEFYDPMKNLIKKQLFIKNASNVYVFRTATTPDAITGNYSLTVTVGAAHFSKSISIETIKPNRLKINLTSNTDILSPNTPTTMTLHAEWLQGALASNLKAQVDACLYPITTVFKGYEKFTFDDPSKKYYPQQENIVSKELDNNGNLTFTPSYTVSNEAPGMMKAVFTTKVFEKGGEFSIDQSTFTYYPYTSFVGLAIPEGDKDYHILYTNTDHPVQIVSLLPNGKLNSETHPIEVGLYKLDWRWWWDQQSADYEELNYNAQSYVKLMATDTLNTVNGKALWKINVSKDNWGRYLIIVHDLISHHSAGKVVYIDWPDWRSRQTTEHEQASTQLVFTTDKDKYQVNDDVMVTFPGSADGRALISVENSKGIIQSQWISTVAGVNTFHFNTTANMSPNVYINITLIQPYSQQTNDKPVRLYGIQCVNIENPASHLTPVIQMPNTLKSETSCNIKISEKTGKEMYYTIAIVDEGLLSLTHYKTPNPWDAFYAKEAYMFTQWDIYDFIVQGLSGKLMNILTIGGDEALKEALDAMEAQKAKRFKPMVIFMGPYHLKSGATNTHNIAIPNYMGEVRTMVISRFDDSYGSAEKSVKVTKPLMVMPSLPKVFSTGDNISMPVAVFSNAQNLKTAHINVKVKGPVSLVGKSTSDVTLKYNADQTIFFNLVAEKKAGLATIEINAVSGNEKSNSTVQIYVRNPNPFTTHSTGYFIDAGSTKKIDIQPLGVEGTNFTTLEMSAIPSLNLEKNMDFLIAYPHGCLEQTISKAFPQLYLPTLADLSSQKTKEMETNIKIAIQKMLKFQTSEGGFAYWPSDQNIDDWVTNYAGHFMLEAQKAGYTIPSDMLRKWKNYQKTAAQKWFDKGPSSQYTQAYRLYTMALANMNETGAMNRLMQVNKLSDMARYPLAAAYAISGKIKIARTLLVANKIVLTKNMFDDIYGSDMRENSFISLTYTSTGNRKEAFGYIKEIATMLSSNRWYSTQSVSFALIACANYLQGERMRSPMKINYTLNGKEQKQESMKYFYSLPLNNAEIKTSFTIQNQSSFPIYMQLIRKGVLAAESEKDFEKGLSLKLTYTNYNGATIDINNLTQTTDMYAVVQVSNNTAQLITRLALTYSIPSGWEIINDRMIETATSDVSYDYRDIRDDKVMYYFNLSAHQSKTFKIPVNATFAGRFYHPATYCEAMYHDDVSAQLKGYWINVKAASFK